MATQAQYATCESLFHQWVEKRTEMLSNGGYADTRLSSVEVSIQVSLKSGRITNNAHAIKVLQILSLLPNGIDDDSLVNMATAGLDVFEGSLALLQTALAFRDVLNRPKCLAPIREYVQTSRPLEIDSLRPVVHFHVTLAHGAREAAITSQRGTLIQSILPHIGNLQSVLMRGMNTQELCEEPIDAACDIG